MSYSTILKVLLNCSAFTLSVSTEMKKSLFVKCSYSGRSPALGNQLWQREIFQVNRKFMQPLHHCVSVIIQI